MHFTDSKTSKVSSNDLKKTVVLRINEVYHHNAKFVITRDKNSSSLWRYPHKHRRTHASTLTHTCAHLQTQRQEDIVRKSLRAKHLSFEGVCEKDEKSLGEEESSRGPGPGTWKKKILPCRCKKSAWKHENKTNMSVYKCIHV